MHVSSTSPNPLIFHKNEEAYLAVETSLAVLKDNKLTRLVEETVATVTVPAGTRQFIAGDRRRVVQADHEGRGLNLLQQFLVLGVSSNQGLTILKRNGILSISHHDRSSDTHFGGKKAHVSPIITILGGQNTNGKGLGTTSFLNDASKLSLKLAGGELLTVVNGVNNIELVVASNDNVGVLDGVISLLNIRRLDRNTAVVEHVLVRVHAHGLTLSILGLERAPLGRGK